MKKTIAMIPVLLALAALVCFAADNAGLDDGYQGPEINISVSEEYKASVISSDSNITFGIDGKRLVIDLESIVSLTKVKESYRPDTLILSAEAGCPSVSFKKTGEERDIITIMQCIEGESLVHFGTPKDDSTPAVYIVEHYDPDKEMDDPQRSEGRPRLSVILKNNPKAEVYNQGLRVRDSMLYTRAFMERMSAEIDDLGKTRVIEIFEHMSMVFIRISKRFSLNPSYDRGFSVEGTPELISASRDIVDILPGDCSKLGFAFPRGSVLNLTPIVKNFTGRGGYALGIARPYEDHEGSFTEMKQFVDHSASNGIIPIIRIEAEDYMSLDPVTAASFIRELYLETGGRLSLVQVLDKVNSRKGMEEPKEYANFYVKVKESLPDLDIRFIGASLDMKPSNHERYLATLIKTDGFADELDYWASSGYDPATISDRCIEPTIQEYLGSVACQGTAYNYRYEMEIIKNTTGKVFSVMVTDAGFPGPEQLKAKTLLRILSGDERVKAAIIHPAMWNDGSPSWIDEGKKDLTDYAKGISGEVCKNG